MSQNQHIQDSLNHTKCEYRRLGKAGLRVSVPILGAMSIGSSDWQAWVLDEEKSIALLKEAFDRGVTTWDSANGYSNGCSEIVIAKALKKHKIPRHKVQILTKCYFGAAEDVAVNTFGEQANLRKARDYINLTGKWWTTMQVGILTK
jgi:aryl-alcohol dehydrogenase-like predicted oxidoreductase